MGTVAVEEDLNPATWRDGKRYAWMFGLIVPALPFISWFWVEVTGSRRVLVVRPGSSSSGSSRCST